MHSHTLGKLSQIIKFMRQYGELVVQNYLIILLTRVSFLIYRKVLMLLLQAQVLLQLLVWGFQPSQRSALTSFIPYSYVELNLVDILLSVPFSGRNNSPTFGFSCTCPTGQQETPVCRGLSVIFAVNTSLATGICSHIASEKCFMIIVLCSRDELYL